MPLALSLALTAPIEVRSAAVDPALTEVGLRTRVGELADRWTIVVTDTAAPDLVAVELQGPDGRALRRELVLAGVTVEDRSRELAASLALLIEAGTPATPKEPGPTSPRPDPPQGPESDAAATPPPEAPPPDSDPSPPRPLVRGFLALGPRVGLGRGLIADGGADLHAGVWVARERLVPLVELGLTGAKQGEISLLQVRAGAGLAVGAPVTPRIWLGGHVLLHALWLRAREAGEGRAWSSSSDVGALVQYRGRRLYLGLRSGVDITLPPLDVLGADAHVRRGPARWFLSVGLGVLFG